MKRCESKAAELIWRLGLHECRLECGAQCCVVRSHHLVVRHVQVVVENSNEGHSR